MPKSKGGGAADTGQGSFNNYQQYWQPPTGMPSYGNSSKGGGFGSNFGGGFNNNSKGGGFGGGNIGGGNFGGNFGGGNGFNNQQFQPRMPSLQQQYGSLNQGVSAFQPLGIRGYTPPPQFGFGGGYGNDYGGGYGYDYGGGYNGGFNPFNYNAFGQYDTVDPVLPPTTTPPPVTTPSGPYYPGGSPYDFEPDFGYEDFGNMDFEREYGLKDDELLLPPPPQTYTTQVVEGGADIRVPTAPTPESVRPDFNADLNIPDFSNYTLPTTFNPQLESGFIEGGFDTNNLPFNQQGGPSTIEKPIVPIPNASPVAPPAPVAPPIPPQMQDAFERGAQARKMAGLGAMSQQMPQAPRDPNFTPDPNAQGLTGASQAGNQHTFVKPLQVIDADGNLRSVQPENIPAYNEGNTELAELVKRAGGGSDLMQPATLQPATLQPAPQKTSTASSIMQFLGTDASEADSFDQATLLKYDYNKDGTIDLLDAQKAKQNEEKSALKDRTFAEENQGITRLIDPRDKGLQGRPEGELETSQPNYEEEAAMLRNMQYNQASKQQGIGGIQEALDNRTLGPVRNSQSIIEYLGTDDGDSGIYDKTYDKNNDGVVDMLDAQAALQSEEANAIRPMPNPNGPAVTKAPMPPMTGGITMPDRLYPQDHPLYKDQGMQSLNPIPRPNIGEVDPRKIGGIGGAAGGLVKGYAVGGQIEGNESSDRLEEETVMALMGKHPNPKEVFTRYLEAYGEEGLMALAAEVEEMMASQGRMIDGAGGGVDDAIPAMIDGQQPASLSKDEYVIPADVVAHAGDGSSEAGGKKFDQLVSRVRKTKTGKVEQPEQIEFEEQIGGVI